MIKKQKLLTEILSKIKHKIPLKTIKKISHHILIKLINSDILY